MSFIGGVVPCGVCGKRVYGAERADADGQTFHKACMRCAECNCIVKLGSYAALGGKFYCKPHFRQLFARSGNYHGAFEGQSDPKAKWLESMSAEVEAQGMGKDLRRVQSHVVQRPPAPRTTTALLREAEDQFTPAQQARKSLTPDEDTSYSKRRSFFERIASGPGTTAKRVFLRSHSKDEHQKKSSSEEAEVAPEAHKDKGKSKLRKHDKKESAEKEADQQAQAQAQAQANAQAQAKREEEAAAAAAAQQQKEEAERREREAQENRVREQEEREAREKVEEKRRAAIEEKRRAREQAEAESAAAAEQAAREQAARELEEQKTKKAEQEQLEEQKRQAEQAAAVAAAEAAEQEKREKEQQQQQEQQLRAADEARAQREREEALAKAQREREEAERQRRQQQEAAAQARREKEEAERKARAEAAEARRREVEASKAKEASPSTSPSTSPSLGGDQAAGTPQSTSFSRVRNLTMRFAEQQKNGKGGKDLSIEGLKQQGHFKSIRDRWQFGDFAIPAYNKKGN